MFTRSVLITGVGIMAAAAAMILAALPRESAAKLPTFSCNFGAISSAKAPQTASLAALTRGSLTPIPLNSVQVIDKRILRKVLVQGLFARRTDADTVEVIARIANCTDYPLQLEGRTAFQDEAQIPSEPVSAWQRLYLAPKSLTVYRELSTGTSNVSTFLVELREGA